MGRMTPKSPVGTLNNDYISLCDECGKKFKLFKMRKVSMKCGGRAGYVCEKCYNTYHYFDFLPSTRIRQ